MTLGNIIRQNRQRLGLSQPDLASRAQIEQSYLSKLENDHSAPSDEILKRVMLALELDIASLCAQLDTHRVDPKVLHIESIRTYLASHQQKSQRRNIVLMTLFTLIIGIGVALFYVGHAQAFFPGTLYSYESPGEIQPDEPADYYHGGWRRALTSLAGVGNNEVAEQIRQAETVQANRVEYHTLQSFQPLENNFTRHLDNGNRRFYRVRGSTIEVARPQNGWLMFFGIVLSISGLIALVMLLRLGAHDSPAGGH